jgi:hypothetical protein
MDVSVNGTVVKAGQSFPGTANWDTWADASLTVPLNAGNNTIRVTATSANGAPNLDYLDLAPREPPEKHTARWPRPTGSAGSSRPDPADRIRPHQKARHDA